MQYLQISDWNKMQHYKHRNPPWIKLYAEMLDDENFFELTDHCQLLYFQLLLLASRRDNKIKNNLAWISKQLPMHERIDQMDINALIKYGFIEESDGLLASCYQHAMPEKSREEESKEEKSISYKLTDIENIAPLVGVSDDECKVFYDHYNSQGWLKGNGLPITDLKSQLTNWKNNGYKFPDKPKPAADPEKAQTDQWERQCGDWLRQTDKEMILGHPNFMDRLKNPKYRIWAESINPVVKEI